MTINGVANSASPDNAQPVDQTKGARGSSSANYSDSSSDSQNISSMGKLKEVDPKSYDLWMKSCATTIIDEMKKNEEHLKKTMREGQSQA